MKHFITLLLWLLLSLPVMMTAAQDEEAVASLEPFAETIEILPDGETEWQPVTEPMLVNEGDQIRTDAGGWALLTYFEGVSTEILPETEVTVTTLELPTEEDGAFSVSLNVVAGETFNVVDAVLDQGSSFEVKTPNATAAVRGTRFYVRYSPETGQTSMGVEEGTVLMLDPADPDTALLQVEAGLFVETDATGNPSAPTEDWEPTERPVATCDPATEAWCIIESTDAIETPLPPPAGDETNPGSNGTGSGTGGVITGNLLLGQLPPGVEDNIDEAQVFVQITPTPPPPPAGIPVVTVPAPPVTLTVNFVNCITGPVGNIVNVTYGPLPTGAATTALNVPTRSSATVTAGATSFFITPGGLWGPGGTSSATISSSLQILDSGGVPLANGSVSVTC